MNPTKTKQSSALFSPEVTEWLDSMCEQAGIDRRDFEAYVVKVYEAGFDAGQEEAKDTDATGHDHSKGR